MWSLQLEQHHLEMLLDLDLADADVSRSISLGYLVQRFYLSYIGLKDSNDPDILFAINFQEFVTHHGILTLF
jgi:hypothetical protein